jgi:hypothetical protein
VKLELHSHHQVLHSLPVFYFILPKLFSFAKTDCERIKINKSFIFSKCIYTYLNCQITCVYHVQQDVLKHVHAVGCLADHHASPDSHSLCENPSVIQQQVIVNHSRHDVTMGLSYFSLPFNYKFVSSTQISVAHYNNHLSLW